MKRSLALLLALLLMLSLVPAAVAEETELRTLKILASYPTTSLTPEEAREMPMYADFEAIFERVKDQCDLFWLENLNLRGGFKKTIMDYIAGKYPDLVPLYDEIYNKHNRSYFEALEVKAEEMAKKYDCPFVDNEMPYGRVPQGHPVIVDYFYHEEIRGTENTGKRNC